MNNNTVRFIWRFFFVYLVLLITFSFLLHTKAEVFVMQLLFALEVAIVFNLLQKSQPLLIAMVSAILIIPNTLFARFILADMGMHAFGPDPIDSILYMKMSLSHESSSFVSYLSYLENEHWAFDNLGMFVIGWFAGVIGGSESGYVSVMLAFNVLAIFISTFFIYKSASLYLKEKTSKTVTLIWGLHQGFLAFTVYGLKENFFLTIVVLAIYHLICYIKKHKTSSLLFGLLFIFTTLLFRYSVGAQLTIAYFMTLLSMKLKRNKWLFFLSVLIVYCVIIFYLNNIIIFLGQEGGLDIFHNAENNTKGYSLPFLYTLEAIYCIFGVPANFMGVFEFGHLMTFTSLVNGFISAFFLLGLAHLFKSGKNILYLLFFYWIMGVFMLTLVFRGADIRFGSLYYPPYLLLAAAGYEKRHNFKYSKTFTMGIGVFIILLTCLWNK